MHGLVLASEECCGALSTIQFRPALYCYVYTDIVCIQYLCILCARYCTPLMLTALAYTPVSVWLLVSLLCCVCATLSKETGLTGLALCLVYDLCVVNKVSYSMLSVTV